MPSSNQSITPSPVARDFTTIEFNLLSFFEKTMELFEQQKNLKGLEDEHRKSVCVTQSLLAKALLQHDCLYQFNLHDFLFGGNPQEESIRDSRYDELINLVKNNQNAFLWLIHRGFAESFLLDN